MFAMPQPLSVLERGTANCLVQAIEQTHSFPHLAAVRKLAKTNLDFSCADRASSNNAAEDIIHARENVPRCRLPCLVHCVSTAQGRSWCIVSDDISGAIGLALEMGHTGRVDRFRECIVFVLVSSIDRILDCEPLPPQHLQNMHLASLLRLSTTY